MKEKEKEAQMETSEDWPNEEKNKRAKDNSIGQETHQHTQATENEF